MFRFKQFTVFQSECAMKVGTDGVLLGAWADTHNATRILDIGTGTGLLALMLAQRAPHAEITASEIDPAAVEQAAANAQNSPWGDRIRIIGGDFGKHIFKEKFDLIVSNPPYFCNSLKNPDEKRKTARHDDTLTQETLAKGIAEIIAKNGTACVIYPTAEGESFIKTASYFGLHCTKRTDIHPQPGSPVKRLLLQFSPTEGTTITDAITIENGERHQYTDEYIALTKDFYLNF